MKYKIYGAVVASLGMATVMLSTNETLARPAGVAQAAPAAPFVAPPGMHRPPGAHAFRPHHRGAGFGFPGGYGGGFIGGVPYGDAPVNVQPIPDKYHYTYSYDVPWDWTHRYPLTLPSDRPYVPSCNTEVVTVPGRGGDRSINVTRCY